MSIEDKDVKCTFLQGNHKLSIVTFTRRLVFLPDFLRLPHIPSQSWMKVKRMHTYLSSRTLHNLLHLINLSHFFLSWRSIGISTSMALPLVWCNLDCSAQEEWCLSRLSPNKKTLPSPLPALSQIRIISSSVPVSTHQRPLPAALCHNSTSPSLFHSAAHDLHFLSIPSCLLFLPCSHTEQKCR